MLSIWDPCAGFSGVVLREPHDSRRIPGRRWRMTTTTTTTTRMMMMMMMCLILTRTMWMMIPNPSSSSSSHGPPVTTLIIGGAVVVMAATAPRYDDVSCRSCSTPPPQRVWRRRKRWGASGHYRHHSQVRGGADFYPLDDDTEEQQQQHQQQLDSVVTTRNTTTMVNRSLSSTKQQKSWISGLFGDWWDAPVAVPSSATTCPEHPSSSAQLSSNNFHHHHYHPTTNHSNTTSHPQYNVTSTNTGRGGALVQHPTAVRHHWWWPSTTPSSSSSSSLLLPSWDGIRQRVTTPLARRWFVSNTETKVVRESHDRTTGVAASTHIRWWVDTWADHLPDDDDDEHGLTEEETLSPTMDPEEATMVNPDRIVRTTNNETTTRAVHPSVNGDDNDNDDDDDMDHLEVTSSRYSGNLRRNSSSSSTTGTVVPSTLSNTTTTTTQGTTITSNVIQNHRNETTTTSSNTTLVVESSLARNHTESLYTSSGSWRTIDRVISLGYADTHPQWRVSARLRTIRKGTARITGLHGVLSGKPRPWQESQWNVTHLVEDPKMGLIRRRLAAIDRARQNIERITMAQDNKSDERAFLFWNRNKHGDVIETSVDESMLQEIEQERVKERKRSQRVKEIDALIQTAQKRLVQLACEKDLLQQRPNPLWNYSTTTSMNDLFDDDAVPDHNHQSHDRQNDTFQESSTPNSDRTFNYPSPDLVDEYLETLFMTGRLIRMNQTELWRQSNDNDDDDDVDALMTRPASPSHRRTTPTMMNGNPNTAAPWLLRNFVGEKIGEAVEIAAYKSVCTSLMTILAKSISNLHGVNVMGYSDIRLHMEETPIAPPPVVAKLALGTSDGIPSSNHGHYHKHRNYAQEAFQDVMRRGSSVSATKQQPQRHTLDSRTPPTASTFIQRDAIVETLLSQCQMAAPLLNLFPLSLQRALMSNMVILCTAIMTDFFEGLEFHLFGHRLSFTFQPITEADMMKHMSRDDGFHHSPRPIDPDLFDAAVRATADDVSENLKILDRWHERVFGGGVVRTQIATIIARVVLTLVDDTLRAARMDLWSSHAGGPKLSAALEYRRVRSTVQTT